MSFPLFNFDRLRRSAGWVKRAGVWIIHVLDSIAFRLLGAAQPVPGKILLIRLDDIGDFVVWLDAAKEIRRLYPPETYHITLLANANWSALAQETPHFDMVWPIHVNRFLGNLPYRYKTMNQVRRAGFSTVIHITSNRRYYDSVFVRAAGAPESIGHRGEEHEHWPGFVQKTDGWYTRLIGSSNRYYSEFQKNAELIRALGHPTYQPHAPQLSIPISKLSPSLASLKLEEPFYILVPGAKDAYRRWPPQNFAKVAQYIYSQKGWPGLICGSTADDVAAQSIIQSAAGIPLENMTGKTTLIDLALLIQRAKLVVTNETSASHLAVAVRTPALTILGGGHFGRFMPYEVTDLNAATLPRFVTHPMDCFCCNWHCIYKLKNGEPTPCIAGISVETVLAEMESMLRHNLL